MSQLPKGWVETSFKEVSDYIQRGKGPKYAEFSEYPVVNQKAVRWFGLQEEHLKYVHPEQWDKWDELRYIREGDILWNSTGTGTIGRACHIDQTQLSKAKVVDSHVTIVRTNKLVESKFAFYWVMHPEIQGNINGLYNGSTNQVELSKKIVESTRFPLAPLAEQTRIVEKLDEVLAQVDTIKARLDGIPAILKRFRQSVLAAAVSGKLTEEWRKNNSGQQIKPLLYEIETQREKLKAAKLLKRSFGKHETVDPQSNELPDGWEWVCFDQISDNENNALKAGPFGSALKKSDCTDHGYRVYGQEQVIAGDETLVSYYINEEKYQQLEACSVKSGDILISLVGTIGKVLILSDKVESGIINPRLVKLSLNSEIQRKYIKAYLDSPLAWHFFNGFSHGGTMDILNLGILRKLPIALPPVEEQKEIVRLVDQYFAFADTIEAQVKKAQARVDKLTQSILAKAFRGELVPQDPNDEPADKLLERIALARKEAEALAKAAKKAANK
ncbi:restriction endonuclease subunit S [Vibrio cholerae]|nr:restriction endonuclease subunit S [Vibrio cholerae]